MSSPHKMKCDVVTVGFRTFRKELPLCLREKQLYVRRGQLQSSINMVLMIKTVLFIYVHSLLNWICGLEYEELFKKAIFIPTGEVEPVWSGFRPN